MLSSTVQQVELASLEQVKAAEDYVTTYFRLKTGEGVLTVNHRVDRVKDYVLD